MSAATEALTLALQIMLSAGSARFLPVRSARGGLRSTQPMAAEAMSAATVEALTTEALIRAGASAQDENPSDFVNYFSPLSLTGGREGCRRNRRRLRTRPTVALL